MTTCAHRCECGGLSAVAETRPSSDGSYGRRRFCLTCSKRWTTYETRGEMRAFMLVIAERVEQVRADAVDLTAAILKNGADP